jgi:hypothetical protein
LVKANVERSIVGPNAQPSTNAVDNYTIVKDEISAIDLAKSEREKVQVVDWPTNTGVEYDEQLGVGIFYNETIIQPSEYTNSNWFDVSNQTIKPLDQWKSLKREIDKDKAASALLAQWYKIPQEVSISLPDKLLGITVYWGSSYGAGGSFSSNFSSGGSYSISASGSSKMSGAVNGDIYFNLQDGFSGSIAGYKHIFFIEIGSDGKVESDEVLNILNNFEQFGQRNQPAGATLNPKYKRWPYLQLRSENIVVISGSESIRDNVSQSAYNGVNGYGSGYGAGQDYDVDVNARSVNIPKSLHGEIKINQEKFGLEGLYPTYGIRPEKLESTKAVVSGEEVFASKFPTGNYLYSSDVELYKWGFVKVTAITVNITDEYI